MTNKKYTVSVIVPVYNVEQYLAETIESFICQTIGFEEAIQVILVNDGSTDGSGDVCVEYRERYPDNIVYIDKKNGGVSSARNEGKKAATGAYVAFIDSDDTVSPNYFEDMIRLLDTDASVPFAAARIEWFGAKTGYHIADFKFTSTRIIDLYESPEMIHSLISSTLFRAEAIEGVFFDEKMTHNEDAKFIDTVLLKWGEYRYGAVREALLRYRKRDEGTSATDASYGKRSFYQSTMRYIAFLTSAGTFTSDGKVPLFIQFHALYHYRWRITQSKKPAVLSDEEWAEYKDAVCNAIRQLEPKVIIHGGINVSQSQKAMLLRLVVGDTKKIQRLLERSDTLRDMLLQDFVLTVGTINYESKKGIIIQGVTSMTEPALFGAKVKFYLDNEEVVHEAVKTADYLFDERVEAHAGFRATVPVGAYGKLTVKLVGSTTNESVKTLDIVYTYIARISMRRYDYRILKRKILLLPSIDSLDITRFTLTKIIKREALFFLQNLLINKYNIEHNAPKTIIVEAVRLLALLQIKKGPSNIWLFSDRAISGGDNSEVLFRYAADKGDSNVRPIFAINENTSAYKRLKEQGYEVVKFRSLKHLYYAIIAEMILPSHMDAMYLYPWFGVWRNYAGLIQYDIAHTQHGIVLNDMSNYIGQQKKNANIFLSVCKWEQKYLIQDGYGYRKDQVPVTGAPRYDELKDTSDKRRVISLHPTWRSWLAGDDKNGKRARNEAFVDSEYYQFYQRLITDKHLMKVLEEADYTLKFYIHPNHTANRQDFKPTSDRVRIMDFPYNYSAMFSESKLFITDYSNTLFDFAYLSKPVVHAQFDFDEFFSGQVSIAKQQFDYERDGFGPVCSDYKSTLDAIVSLIKRDCVLEKKYVERINEFFTYSDARNSQRAYEAVYRHYIENR